MPRLIMCRYLCPVPFIHAWYDNFEYGFGGGGGKFTIKKKKKIK
jgi:hypothetical protein